jgi:purine catabolism regulator
MPVTLHTLVASTALELLPLVESAGAPAAVDWVYSSDLADPTPFLEAGQMLLTTGSQFLDDTAGDSGGYDVYVGRLVDAGIRALGFGTDVVRSGTPEGLVAACRRRGLPLVEVPYRVPFIAIIRFVADALARELHAREAWAFDAQRAVSLAALGADGVAECLRTLARRLARPVVLFDAEGAVSAATPPSPLHAVELAAVADEAGRMLRKGTRASRTLDLAATSVTLQSFGRRGDLTGVLAVAGARLDAAETTVVTAAVALTEVSLAHGGELREGTRVLRQQALALLVGGHERSAREVFAAFDETLPADPVVVLHLRHSDPDGAHHTDAGGPVVLRAGASGHPHAPHGSGMAVLLPHGEGVEAEAERLCERHALAGGLSSPVPYALVAGALAEAAEAATGAAPGTVRRARAAGSMLDLLAEGAARRLADSRLAPLLGLDDAPELLRATAAWLDCNGQWEPAARGLSIHRHTLKARVGQVAALLDLDLDRFETRVELWALTRAHAESAGGPRD